MPLVTKVPPVGVWETISNEILASDTATHTISGISTDYTSFMLIIQSATTHSAEIELRMEVNNDTGTNYSYQYLSATAGTIGANRATGQSLFRIGIGFTNDADDFDYFTILISNKDDVRKTLVSTGSRNQGGAGVSFVSGIWNDVSKITEMDIFAGSGSLRAKSQIILLGLRI